MVWRLIGHASLVHRLSSSFPAGSSAFPPAFGRRSQHAATRWRQRPAIPKCARPPPRRRQSALRINDGSFVHRQVAGRSHLSRQQHVALQHVLPARPVCAQTMLSSPTVQACPTCTSCRSWRPASRASLPPWRGPRGERLDFNIVLDHRRARCTILKCVPSARLANRSRLRPPPPHFAESHDGRRGRTPARWRGNAPENRRRSGRFIDRHMRMQHRVAAHPHAFPTTANGPIEQFSPTTALAATQASG